MTSPPIAYRIETPRLVLRCPAPADAPLLMQAIATSLDGLRAWVPWGAKEPLSLEEKIEQLRLWRSQFDSGFQFVYLLFSKDESEIVGGTGLHLRVGPHATEIGYWIASPHTRLGYAQEASAALAQVAFKFHRYLRVEIHCDPKNVRSANVARQLGFVHEATLRERFVSPLDPNVMRDTMIWSMLARELETSKANEVAITAYDALGRSIT